MKDIDKLSKQQLIEVISKLHERMDIDAKSLEKRARQAENDSLDSVTWELAYSGYCVLRSKCNLLEILVHQQAKQSF